MSKLPTYFTLTAIGLGLAGCASPQLAPQGDVYAQPFYNSHLQPVNAPKPYETGNCTAPMGERERIYAPNMSLISDELVGMHNVLWPCGKKPPEPTGRCYIAFQRAHVPPRAHRTGEYLREVRCPASAPDSYNQGLTGYGWRGWHY